MHHSPPGHVFFTILQECVGAVDDIGAVVAAAFSTAEHSAPPTYVGGPRG